MTAGDSSTQQPGAQGAAALFRAWRSGDASAGDALFQAILGDLDSIASFLLRREQRAVSVATGDLVNETIVKLMQSSEIDVVDRAHLLALAARVMRHALIDRVRKKASNKRDAHHVTMTTGLVEDANLSFDLMALETALIRLARISPERAQLVELRYFAGMGIDDIAIVMATSPATVKRQWTATRIWLRDAIVNDRK